MADTGFLSPTAYEATSNVFFEAAWIIEGASLILFLSGGTQTVKDFSTNTISGTVTGAEVLLSHTYGYFNADASLNIQISRDDGSSFSSGISTGALGLDDTNDETLGSSSNLWGLDWSGFTDLDQLKVKGTEDGGQIAASLHVQIKIYYSTGYGNDIVGLDSGDVSEVVGVATANISKVSGL